MNGNLHSTNGGVPTVVNFINRLDVAVQVFWIDYSGNRILYTTSQPGQSTRQSTYVGHPWEVVATHPSYSLKLAFLPTTSESNVILERGLVVNGQAASPPADGSGQRTIAAVLPDPASDLRSVGGSVSTYITFVNNLDSEVSTYWVNWSGERVFYTSILPGASYRQQTYVGHPWEISTVSQSGPIAVFHPTPYEAIAPINRNILR